MTTTDTTNKLREALLDSASNLSLQSNLLDACIKAGRTDWAIETLKQIKILVDGGLLAAGADVAPASKKVWTPPSPAQMKKALLGMIGSRAEVKPDGNIVACSFNGYLLDGSKADRVVEPLMELIKRAHIILFQETNADAMHALGKSAGYGLNVSHRNNRGQANGILFHPRLHWLGDAPVYHDYGLDIPGHPEFKQTMRPALQRRVKDAVSGFIFDVIDFHAKSNLGGPDETRPIRHVQFEMLVAELAKQLLKTPYKPRTMPREAVAAAPDATAPAAKVVDNSGEELPLGAVIMAGDFNAPIEKPETTEIEPLLKAGFVRVANPGNKWTYRYKEETGGQFDGFFTRGMEGRVSDLWIPNWPDKKGEAWFYREFSDHLPVFVEIKV